MENKINIIVCSPYYPPHIGGLESHAHEFNMHMASSTLQITVCTAKLPLSAPSYEKINEHIAVYRYEAIEILGGFPIPVIWKQSFWAQWKEIQFEHHDIVISRTRFFLSSLLARYISYTLTIPHIHIEHGSDHVHLKNRFLNFFGYVYDKIFGVYVLRAADTVVANSHATAHFVEHLTRNHVHPQVIYRGIETSCINKIEHIKIDTDDKKTILCFIGRLVYGKGVQDMIKAIANSSVRNEIICWIIGDGSYRQTLENLVAEYNLQANVIFFGKCSYEKSISVLKSSDIFINPSYTEGLPTSVIESALCKKAIIATRVGGTGEIIIDKKTGILVAPGDINQLSLAVNLLVKNKNLRDIYGEAAYHHAQKTFSWDHAIKEYMRVIHRLL